MNFALSDEQLLLRASARELLADQVDIAALLAGRQTRQGIYESLWRQMVSVGWPGGLIPQRFGGAESSFLDMTMVWEEAGRALAPSPLFGSTAGVLAILYSADEVQKQKFLTAAASGDARFAFALPQDKTVEADIASIAEHSTGHRITGSYALVVDAFTANHLVLTATVRGIERTFVVDRNAVGLTVEPLRWRDITREVCRVYLKDTPGELLMGDSAGLVSWIRNRLYVMLAADSLGGMKQLMDATLAYANERMAFGRPIGANQAIKHQLADMKGQIECASVAVLYAAWMISAKGHEAGIAAAMAQSFTSNAYSEAALRSIQIFGAVGFTWEMTNHLYLKRAMANAEMLGPPRMQRAELIDMLVREGVPL